MYKFEAQVAKILRAEIGDLVPIQPKIRAAYGEGVGGGEREGTADPARPLELGFRCGLQPRWQAPRHRQWGPYGEHPV